MKTQPRKFTNNIPDEELINDVIAVAKKLRKNTVTTQDYMEHGTYSVSTLKNRFRSWFIVMQKAGLVPSRSGFNIAEELLLKNLEDVWNYSGKQPTAHLLKKKSTAQSRYSISTYCNHFGSWRNALIKFMEYQAATGGQKQVNLYRENMTEAKTIRANKRNVPFNIRMSVFLRDGFRCQCCGRSPITTPGVILHCDHINAWIKGGKTVMDNLITLCSECNMAKGDR